jgi:hypothetical protein
VFHDGRQKDLLEIDVKRTNETNALTRSIPLHDYRPALQGAVSWLGDRYLLAEPVPRRGDSWHPSRWAALRHARATSSHGSSSSMA